MARATHVRCPSCRTVKPAWIRPDGRPAPGPRRALGLCRARGQSNGPANSSPWYRNVLVGMEVGPTGAQFGSDPSDVGYAAQFDGRAIVKQCVAAGCEYVVIWARDGEYAYYDSKVMPKCPGLGTRDVLRETVQEARIGTVCRSLPTAWCSREAIFSTHHPELAMRGSDGKLLGRYCYNSGYLAIMKRLTGEMLAYGIDGFHIDMLDQGFGPPYGCWCDACQRRFEAAYHRPMPKGVTWDADWDHMLEFRYTSSRQFEQALRDHIHSVAPQASVDFNYHGNPPFSWEVGQRPVEHAGNGDFVTGETGVWGFSALGVGLNAEFYRAATPGIPFQVAMQRGVRMYHDQTTRPLNDLRWELLTLLAHGAFVTVVDKTAYDGWLDPVAYRRIGEAFREAKARRGSFAGRAGSGRGDLLLQPHPRLVRPRGAGEVLPGIPGCSPGNGPGAYSLGRGSRRERDPGTLEVVPRRAAAERRDSVGSRGRHAPAVRPGRRCAHCHGLDRTLRPARRGTGTLGDRIADRCPADSPARITRQSRPVCRRGTKALRNQPLSASISSRTGHSSSKDRPWSTSRPAPPRSASCWSRIARSASGKARREPDGR